MLVVVAVAVALILLGWYVADYLYVRSLPVGLDYGYTYRVDVGNVSSGFELLVPVPVLQGDVVLPALGLEGEGASPASVIDTEHGIALSMVGTEDATFLREGSFDARTEAPDHRDDGTPVLSMSPMTHEWQDWRGDEPGSAWVYSDTEGVEVSIEFSSLGKSWRTYDGTFTSGYVRGGWGYTLYLVAVTQVGWHEYPVHLGWIEVE